MTFSQRVQPVVVGLLALVPKAQAAANAALSTWQSYVQQFLSYGNIVGSEQIAEDGVLNDAYTASATLVAHLVAFHGIIFDWAQNEDQRIPEGLQPYPYPAPTQDVAAYAAANSLSLALPPDTNPPPAPIVIPYISFMVPGGYLAVMAMPVTQQPSGRVIRQALQGDTVPSGMTATATDDQQLYLKMVQAVPWGLETYYVQLAMKPA